MEIIKDEKILRQKSKEFKDNYLEFEAIIALLEVTLNESNREGIGLAAIQIGIPKRVAIIRTSGLSLDLYNPEILSASNMILFKGESCLSLPATVSLDILRPNKLTLKNGDGKIYKLEGLEAICCQHEIDHMNGILITDRIF